MPKPSAARELKARILEILRENRVMSVATVRMDGWPQATLVGYAHDDLHLYFTIARNSQKLSNIRREPRISIALGHGAGERIRGLSMAAWAAEVTDVHEMQRISDLVLTRYPDANIFAPRAHAAALVRAVPELISVIDLTTGPGEPELVAVKRELAVEAVSDERGPPRLH